LLEACGLITLLVGVILVSGPGHSRGGRDPAYPGVCGACSVEDASHRIVACQGDEEESVMGVAKKAKHKAKAAKSKTKKDAGKVKHKGKKAKNAARH
jgi:hypothetical protein